MPKRTVCFCKYPSEKEENDKVKVNSELPQACLGVRVQLDLEQKNRVFNYKHLSKSFFANI